MQLTRPNMATAKSSLLYGLVVQGKEKAVPLENVAITGQITGYVVSLQSTLSYKNLSDDPLEVMFRFPVDDDMAVVGLEARIDGRTIRGVVQEKEEARATYDDAIASGLTAALGEEKTGDIFSLSLGNLPPKAEAQLVLKLVGELPLEGEAIRFSLPAVLKPRYTPTGGSIDPLAPVVGTSAQTGTAPAVSHFNIQVTCTNVDAISSPTHDIVTTAIGDGISVCLKELGPLVKDLVILVTSKDPHVPHATVEEAISGNGSMASPVVMLDFFPSFESVQAACEFVFVVDRSGSMSGHYINSAKETLILFLKSIPPGCYFNIIGFGSRYEHLFPTSVPYNQSNLDKAMKHATGLEANLGGTELLNPLQFVFGQKLLEGLPRQVFVLTDGSVSNTMACIDETKRNANIARVFTFGIGSGASTALVKGLARAGNGSAEFIKEGDRMQSKVISSLKKALQPAVTDLKLLFSIPDAKITIVQSPQKIPPVFNGEKIVMYGLLKGILEPVTGVATLTGNVVGQLIEHTITFQVTGVSKGSTAVHQLAAKRFIKDYEEDEKKKKDVIMMSVESGVVSKLTAYVAVDEEQDKPITGAMKVWDLTAASDDRRMFKGKARSRGRGGGGGIRFMATASSSRAFSAPLRKSTGISVPKKKSSAKKAMPTSSFFEEKEDEDDEMEVETFEAIEQYKSSCTVLHSTSGLPQLITLQSAEGYWSLDKSFASLTGKTISQLKDASPPGCSEEIWATLLALALLESKFTSQQDEWELLAMKAEMWLQSQSLSSTLQSLKQVAIDTII